MTVHLPFECTLNPNQSICFKVAALKLHGTFTFLQICKEMLCFCLLATVKSIFIGLLSLSSTLSCRELCTCFICCFCHFKQILKGSNAELKRPYYNARAPCFYSRSIKHERIGEVGSVALIKELESLKVNTTKLSSNLVRMSSPLLPH